MTEISTPKKKRFVVTYSEKAKENLKVQQGRYMKKNGAKIRQEDLALILLETARLR